MIEVFQVGSPVIIGEHIEARVLAISIYEHNRVSYQVVWWDGNTRKTDWLESFEVQPHKGEITKLRIGFKSLAPLIRSAQTENIYGQEKKED